MARSESAFGFPKALHLRKSVEFRLVFDNKCSDSDGLLVMYARGNSLGYSRLGLSVSRRVGSAVARNRLRRLYREAFRLTRPELPSGIDLVLVPRGTKAVTLIELKQSLLKLARSVTAKLSRRSDRQ